MRLSEYQIRSHNETERVLALPIVEDPPDAMAWANETFKAPGCKWEFRPHQAAALWAMHKYGGAVLPIGVGAGKTLIFWLAPKALGVRRAVGMMPPRDVGPYLKEIERYKDAGFLDDPTIDYRILPYNELSRPDASRLLSSLAPEAIICDEAHTLANVHSARTKRFLHYMSQARDTKFVAMSGTMFTRSVTDAAHLSALALRDQSPLPRLGAHLSAWSACLDVKGDPLEHERRWFEPVIDRMGVDDTTFGFVNRAREAAHKRFVYSNGIVTTDKASCELPLRINLIDVPVPPELSVMADKVIEDLELGDEVFETDEDARGTARRIISGFYYTDDWGGREPDVEFVMVRRSYMSALRFELAARSRPDYDSRALIEADLERRLYDDPEGNSSQLLYLYKRYKEVRGREPAKKTVWLDKYLIDWVLERYGPGDPVILWYQSEAMEAELTRRGVPCYGRGTTLEGPARFVAASIRVHGQGRRLHAWQKSVVLEMPGSGRVWEQLLGRLHRAGQTDAVQFDVLVNPYVRHLIPRALDEASFIARMQGQPQRLQMAEWSETTGQ